MPSNLLQTAFTIALVLTLLIAAHAGYKRLVVKVTETTATSMRMQR